MADNDPYRGHDQPRPISLQQAVPEIRPTRHPTDTQERPERHGRTDHQRPRDIPPAEPAVIGAYPDFPARHPVPGVDRWRRHPTTSLPGAGGSHAPGPGSAGLLVLLKDLLSLPAKRPTRTTAPFPTIRRSVERGCCRHHGCRHHARCRGRHRVGTDHSRRGDTEICDHHAGRLQSKLTTRRDLAAIYGVAMTSARWAA